MEMLKQWADNYHKVLKCTDDTEGADEALGAFKVADAYVRTLTKAQQKVLRLRYLEGAGWLGIGRLFGMSADWAKRTAAEGIAHLEQLIELQRKYGTP